MELTEEARVPVEEAELARLREAERARLRDREREREEARDVAVDGGPDGQDGVGAPSGLVGARRFGIVKVTSVGESLMVG